MGHADTIGTLFHDHGLGHGAATPAANWHDATALSLGIGSDHDDDVHGNCEKFWIDLGGEG